MIAKISQDEARQMVKDYSGSQIFTVTFVKRTTGEIRQMNCRKGVYKGTKGGELKFNPVSKGLVGVYDMKKGKHRFISLDEIKKISLKSEVYEVV